MSRAVSASTKVPASDKEEPASAPPHEVLAVAVPAWSISNKPEALMKALAPEVWSIPPKAWTALGRASIASV
jgi:hypothetical protein